MNEVNTERITRYQELPKGYIPVSFEQPRVRSLYDLYNDFTTDMDTWMDDLMDTLKEIELPAEYIHEQDEELRILQYQIDQLAETDPQRQALQEEQDELLDRYSRERVTADERVEERFVDEVKHHYVRGLNILAGADYEIKDPDLAEAELTEEELLQGYEPAEFEHKEIRDADELREEFEDDDGYPVDEGEWTRQMQDFITEEVMPYQMVYGNMERLRKLQYQIDRLEEDPNLAGMTEPFPIPELEEELLTPDQLALAKKDLEYKKDLNRRFDKKAALQSDLEGLADLIAEDYVRYQDEIDRRMEEETAARAERVEQHWEEKRQALAQEKELAEQAKREEQERLERDRQERELLKEERRRRAEEELEQLEEQKKQAQREQEERERILRQREKESNDSHWEYLDRRFGDMFRRQREQREREEAERRFREEQQKLREQIKKDPREAEPEAGDDGRMIAGGRPSGAPADGTSLDQLLRDGENPVAGGDIVIPAGEGGDFFETRPQEDIVIPAGGDGGFFEKRPEEEIEIPQGAGGDFFETRPQEDIVIPQAEGGDFFERRQALQLENVEDVLEPHEMQEYLQMMKEEARERERQENPEVEVVDPEEEREREAFEEEVEEAFYGEDNDQPQAENVVPQENNLQQEVPAEREPVTKPANDRSSHLTDGQRCLLGQSAEFNQLAEMFETKKRFRWLGNTTSREYDQAQTALRDFMRARIETGKALRDLEQQLDHGELTEEQYRERCRQAGTALETAATTLQDKMRAYAVHATGGREGQLGNKTIADMKQAAGAARLSAAMGVLENIANARALDGIETAPLSQTRQQERVKETSYQELYNRKFGEISKESDRHRRAAAYAQEEIRKNPQQLQQNAPHS